MLKFRSVLRLCLPGLVCLALVACAQPERRDVTAPQAVVTPPPAADVSEKSQIPVTAATVPNPVPRQRPSEDERRRLSETAPPEAAADVAGKPDFASLIGRSFDGVLQLLGAADQVIDVPPGREWLYRDGTCRLVIRFYPDMKTLAYRVLSYSIEDGETVTAPAQEGLAATVAPREDNPCRARLAARFKPQR